MLTSLSGPDQPHPGRPHPTSLFMGAVAPVEFSPGPSVPAGATLAASLQRCLSRVCAWLCTLLICSLMQGLTSDWLLDLPCHHRLVWWSWSALLRLMVAVEWSPSQWRPCYPCLTTASSSLQGAASCHCSLTGVLKVDWYCFTALVK